MGMVSKIGLPIPAADYDELRAYGIADGDIRMALEYQGVQRDRGVPVLSVREICGLPATDPAEAQAPLGKRPPRLSRGGLHITDIPVHGGSKEAGGRIEQAFYRRLTAEDRDSAKRAIMEAFARRTTLRRELRAGERTELSLFDEQCLKITRSVRDVFLALLNMERVFRGRVFPSYEQIGQEANCGRTTVWEALGALEAIGLIERLRRYLYKRKAGRFTSEQTSNAYRFKVPELLRKLFPFWRRSAPLPADEISRQKERTSDFEAMRATLTEDERIMLDTGDSGLGRCLVALRRAVALKAAVPLGS